MLSKKLMFVALAAMTQAWLFAQMQAKRQQRHQSSSKTKVKPTVVQTWEGEGGALRVTGPQLGPEPSASSVALAPSNATAVPNP